MLIGLQIRDVVLIEALDLSIGPGLTALTGETGAGKSIILDALGLATGARGDAGLVRRGAAQAVATAAFAPAPDHPVWDLLEEKGLAYARDEDLVLRRTLSADGRSRAFVNDQATGVGVLKELGEALLEVHGQHETVGLLDARTHRPLLDAYGALDGQARAVADAWGAWRTARDQVSALREDVARSAAETEELTFRLSELDRLDPREGEETELAEARAVLGAAEKALADIGSARDTFDGLGGKVAGAIRALERARERALTAGAAAEGPAVSRLAEAAEALDRVLMEAAEAEAAIDAAAAAFDFEPDRLEKTEERLFDLRGLARKLNVPVEELPALRVKFAERLRAVESSEESLKAAEAAQAAARTDYLAAAGTLTQARRAAGDRLAEAVMAELAPLKLEKARFRVAVEPLAEDRAGPAGLDRVAFEISTNPGAPFGDLGAIASGGELARFALALKAALAGRAAGAQPLMIFDEVDQGVGGAVADAVGLRLKRLASAAQVLVVTHSPQVAARAEAHWRIAKAGDAERIRTAVEVLSPADREEEIARMLAGAQITDAARAAARALMDA
ncbi:MAG: DNA repair protein RecN [Phenylobacterium sp. RIFCSPHIGHO2_01_FULL_69_31]|jgi:DNA repair protein RecN (Recombination protein N)|uniref:DNA repair protein RecN n=1 Tax=Phenylobacterium sp. RIFCSPHIGHO2_01_FULL_69_31 TaxID=1801944 RepID=UPI0008B83B2F|nr:DNA repair protein RecN [Phenylobacterium sp. RIFCSPHIGHO2_01_FULL_69_31]OHB31785.1 MAG: DNA repair protein RecN [Phenylobacterium sp. RIFCSPHIGHO2_01_FULL_69_31]